MIVRQCRKRKKRYPEMGHSKKVIKILWVKNQMHRKYDFKNGC